MPRPILLIALIALWLVLLVCFHGIVEPFPAGVLLHLVVQVALLCLVAVAAWGLGAVLLRPLRLPGGKARWIVAVMQVGAGLGGLALAIFILAAGGLLYREAVIALLAAGVAAFVMLRRELLEAPAAGSMPFDGLDAALTAVLVLAGALTLGAALAPPEFYDSLIYHLAIPQLYIEHHRMVPIEHNFFAGYPANMGMLYAMGLLLRDPSFAQALHWLCGALCVAAVYAIGARHLDRTGALLAAVIFALTPGVMLASGYAIADLTVTLFGTLCFAAILEWWISGDRRWMAAAGIAAGLAMGTKYTALLMVWLPAAVAVGVRPGDGWRRRAAGIGTLTLLSLALLMPWLARNALFTGNPVSPYLEDSTDRPGMIEEVQRHMPAGGGAAAMARHVLSGPWNASMKSLGAAGYIGPIFLMMLPALFFIRPLPRLVAPASIMAAIGTAAWSASMQITRYLMPVLPLAALLAAVAARRLPRRLAVPAVAWPLAYGLYLYTFLVLTIGAWRPVTGAETAESYLTRRIDYYPAAHFLDTLPDDARVMMLGEGRTFYIPRRYRASTPYDPLPLERLALLAPGGEQELVGLLQREGFTHMLVSDPELRRARATTADDLMRRYFPGGSPRLVFDQRDVRVYALPEARSASAP